MAFVDDSGDLKKNTLVPEDASNDITIGALHYDYDTDFGTVSLIAGYQDKNNASVSDQTAFLGLQALGIPFVGSQSQAVEGYSTEIRFASNSGGFFDYLRSEEHTSELQSLMRSSYAVFCLKKKK